MKSLLTILAIGASIISFAQPGANDSSINRSEAITKNVLLTLLKYVLIDRRIQPILLITALLLGININAQNYAWAKSFGGANNELSKSITLDASGNVYTTGYFQGTVDFNPGIGAANLTSFGSYDVYITKFDAQGNFVWVKQLGGTSNDQGFSINVDPSGNILISGLFSGTADLDPGLSISNFTSNGEIDNFITKLDPLGDFLWAKQIGGITNEYGFYIKTDTNGTIYLTGDFETTVDFNPGSGIAYFSSQGGFDIIIVKLDNMGNYLWAKQLSGTSAGDKGLSLVVDNSGNIYTIGTFQGTVDFNPGSGSATLSSAGGQDIFISKLDVSGNYVWAKKMGGSGNDQGVSIDILPSGNIVSTGFFGGTVDFDPGIGVENMVSNGGLDIFINTLDPSGNYLWSKQIGGTGNDSGSGLDSDASGKIYCTGQFTGTVDFDPSVNTYIMSGAGGQETYTLKLNDIGDFQWSKKISGTGNEMSYSIVCDDQGSVHTTGIFGGTVDFDPGVGNANLTSAISFDAYIQKLVCSSRQTITVASCENYVSPSGNYTWTATGTYMDTIANFQGCDSIITFNLTINNPSTGTATIVACDSFTWIDGHTYMFSNNTATYMLTNAAGCDSTVMLNLTINHPTTGEDTIVACDSYTWIDGNNYTSSNNFATYTLTNAAGCDSIVTLNLTINHSTIDTDIVVACESYTWIDGNTYTSSNNSATYTLPNTVGCDSIITLALTIYSPSSNTISAESCASYTLNGETYTASGTYTQTLSNSVNCDSTITLNLTIFPEPVIEENNAILSVTAIGTVQWLNCPNFTPISGAIATNFSPIENGSYAVVVDNGSCSDTSSCFTVNYIGITSLSTAELNIYPNPTSAEVIVNMISENGQLTITDLYGKQLLQKEITSGQHISLSEAAAGIYVFKLKTTQGTYLRKIVKN